MPEETFSEVSTDNGVILGDGAHKLVCFMGVPGMSKSLGLDSVGLSEIGSALGRSSYTVTCTAKDFALGNMMFVAVPVFVYPCAGLQGCVRECRRHEGYARRP